MSRRLRSYICIVGTVSLLLSVIPLTNYLKPVGYNLANIRGIYQEKENSLDIIYIGGSAAFVYWVPFQAWNDCGVTSYNYANDSMMPQSIKYLMQEASQTQTPKLWVIDLRPFQYGDERVGEKVPVLNTTSGMKTFSPNRLGLIHDTVMDPSEKISLYCDILFFRSNWLSNTYIVLKDLFTGDSSVTDFLRGEQKNDLKGFWFIEDTMPVSFTDWSEVEASTPIGESIQPYFFDLLDYCEQEQFQVLFVVHSYCQQEEDKTKYNYMKDIIEDHGFCFLNTNDYWREMGLDYDFDFYNGNHVNIFGAEKYTDFLLSYIMERYQIPDHRTDPAFSEWDALSVKFYEQVNRSKYEILHNK